MVNYIEYLNLPAWIAIFLVGIFLILQIVGEILEVKGKVVPELMKIRKYFARKRIERETLKEVQLLLGEVNKHYSSDNITMRNEWMNWVNNQASVYDKTLAELEKKMDKNNSSTLSLLIDNKRNTIIDFASKVIDEKFPVTREQFKRVFKIYEEYEDIIEENGLTNGEVDVAIRIIRDSYETHTKNHSFIEDIRGYK